MGSTDADQPGDAERERLAAIAARVDRLITSPSEVGGRLARFFAPVFRALGWQAKFGSKKLGALLDELRIVGITLPSTTFDAAVRELERNVTIAERCVAVSRRVPTAYASWMQRVLDALRRVAVIDGARRASGGVEARRLGGMDSTRLSPPLRLDLDAKQARPGAGPAASPGTPPTEDTRRKHGEAIAGDPSKARLLELQLAAIDQITEAARSETRFLERRRRLLEGARRLLLDASAALPLDAEGVRARERALADQITHIHRLVASGLDPRVALPFQARSAARRGDRERMYAALAALERFGEFVGDAPLTAAASRALDRGGFAAPSETNAAHADRASRDRSVREVFGERVADEVTRQYDAARAAASAREEALAGIESSSDDAELRSLTLQYLAPGAENAAFAALLSADGCFEVGAALSPVRSREVEEIARLVAHPTREMLLVQARSMDDLPHAVIDDPRTVLLDLASGRLLARRFVERAQRVRERTHLAGEVRVFVLDASTSMLDEGIEMSRARMRDAILVGELATMIRRLDEPGRRVRLSLYYRFFTKRMGELRKVSTGSEAIAAMADFIGKTRTGGTAIQDALLTSFELIRDQKREDPELARASIVLVTDGAAPVDAELLRRAREDAGVPINVSVIALGEENPVLRDLVARQRANGERAFYHFVDDERLAAICRGDGAGRTVHAPPELLTFEEREAERASLSSTLEDALLEVEDLGRTRASGSATRDATAPPAAPGSEGQKALEEAEHRDRLALERRYLRWFPKAAPTTPDTPAAAPTTVATEDLDAVIVLLATIAEIVGELGGDPFHRQADAIEIVERLLVDAQLTTERYLVVVASRDPRVTSALEAVHLSLRPVSERPVVESFKG